MSAARAGSSGMAPSRARTSAFHSGMTDAGDAVERREERAPAPALRLKDLPARRGEPIETAPAHAGLLDPSPLDQAAPLEAIQGRIERRHVEGDGAVGSLADQLRNFVAVPVALLEQGEDERFGAAFAELAIGRHMPAAYVAVTHMSTVRVVPGRAASAGRS